MSTNKRTIIKHGISAMLLTGAALAAPTTAFALNSGDYNGDSCVACHGSIKSTGGSTGGSATALSVSKSSASNILNACQSNKGGMGTFCGAYTNAQANAVASQLGGAANLSTGPTATPTTKPATATPTTKPATATPTTKPATATPTTKPATATPTPVSATATPTTKPATATPTVKPATATPTTKPATSTPTPRPTTSTPVPGPTTGKTVSGSVGSSASGEAATDVFAVTCGRGTVGLNVGIVDNTSPAPVSLLTIQAVKDNAANLITAGSTTTIASSTDDDGHDDDDHDSGSASQLNKGSGVYTVLVSRQLSDAVGAELYSANVDCVGSGSRKPSISYTLKQNQ